MEALLVQSSISTEIDVCSIVTVQSYIPAAGSITFLNIVISDEPAPQLCSVPTGRVSKSVEMKLAPVV